MGEALLFTSLGKLQLLLFCVPPVPRDLLFFFSPFISKRTHLFCGRVRKIWKRGAECLRNGTNPKCPHSEQPDVHCSPEKLG